jgi:Fis family transcriptional regulator
MSNEIENNITEAQDRLAQLFEDCIEQFFKDGKNSDYDPLTFIRKPMLYAAMRYCNGNQSKTAKLLNIARGTLRKDLDKYFGDTGGYFRNQELYKRTKVKEPELC